MLKERRLMGRKYITVRWNQQLRNPEFDGVTGWSSNSGCTTQNNIVYLNGKNGPYQYFGITRDSNVFASVFCYMEIIPPSTQPTALSGIVAEAHNAKNKMTEENKWTHLYTLGAGGTGVGIPYCGLYDGRAIKDGQVMYKYPLAVNLDIMYGDYPKPRTAKEFLRQCKLNGIDLNSIIPTDKEGTEREWRIR